MKGKEKRRQTSGARRNAQAASARRKEEENRGGFFRARPVFSAPRQPPRPLSANSFTLVSSTSSPVLCQFLYSCRTNLSSPTPCQFLYSCRANLLAGAPLSPLSCRAFPALRFRPRQNIPSIIFTFFRPLARPVQTGSCGFRPYALRIFPNAARIPLSAPPQKTRQYPPSTDFPAISRQFPAALPMRDRKQFKTKKRTSGARFFVNETELS